MDVLIQMPEGVVLRDGKPFGEEGIVNGGFHDLPLPQTVAGAVRSAVGKNRSPQFFVDPANAERIMRLEVTQQRFVRCKEDQWESLWPVPADLFFTDHGDDTAPVAAHLPEYVPISAGCGIDLEWKNWLIPRYATRQKPSKDGPFMLTDKAIRSYLEGDPSLAGIQRPLMDESMHVGISAESGTSDDGKLFATKTNCMKAHDWRMPKRANESGGEDHTSANTCVEQPADELALCVCVRGLDGDEAMPENGYLGGERHRAFFSTDCPTFPLAPELRDRSLFKLVLVTPGCFGDWVPDWLLGQRNGWSNLPGTKIELRLRSAVVSRYQNVSGWDYKVKKPKATQRLVPAGSVYLVELRNPDQAADFQEALWGKSICLTAEGKLNQAGKDGYGTCLLADGGSNTDLAKL